MNQPIEVDTLAAKITKDGYVVLPDVLSGDEIKALKALIQPHLQSDLFGRNDFEGEKTERVYGLVGCDPAFGAFTEHPNILPIAEHILGENILLTANQAVNIHPGESPQPFHNDDVFYRVPRPHDMISVSTIWALDDFTDENGGTQIVPGSHLWGDDSNPESMIDSTLVADAREADALATTVTMKAGSVVVFSGSLWHRGGRNQSDQTRLAMIVQYCAPWLRQIENLMLSVPPEKAKALSPRVREMVGYSVLEPFMGHVAGVHPRRLIERV
jgi:ectoine hydroxylase-related dioxygenase (phytanoyl-CoA dioxygenase family)